MKIVHERKMKEDETYLYDTLKVPEWAIARTARALEAIWLSKSLERDSVIDIYKVSARTNINFHELVSMGESIDSAKYRDLFKEYGLRVKPYTHSIFTLYWADSAWNTFALSRAIMSRLQDGDLVTLEPNEQGGGGDQIYGWIESDGTKIEYEMGYGDCYAGCIRKRYWTFKVMDNGQVKFIGVRGAPPCDPLTRD